MATIKSKPAQQAGQPNKASTTLLPTTPPCLVEVIDWSSESGVLTVATEQEEWTVSQVMHSVLPVSAGDQVLLQVINGDWCAMNRLVSEQDLDRPQLMRTEDGWALNCTKSVTIQVGNASLTLSPEGDVRLSGRDLVSEAEGVQRILGERIELN